MKNSLLFFVFFFLTSILYSQNIVVVPAGSYNSSNAILERGTITDLYLQWNNAQGKYIPLTSADLIDSLGLTIVDKGTDSTTYLHWVDSLDKYVPLSIEDFSIATKGYYKEYIALLTQSGTDAPVATVLRNTFGTATWTRLEAGVYKLVFSGFTILADKFICFIGNSQLDAASYLNDIRPTDVDDGGLIFLKNVGGSDGFERIPIHIIVFP